MNTNPLKERISKDLSEVFGIKLNRKVFNRALLAYDKDSPISGKIERAISNYDDFKEFVFSLVTPFGCAGKNRYPDRKTARQWLKRVRREQGVKLDGVYQCKHCQGYHLTSKLIDAESQYFIKI